MSHLIKPEVDSHGGNIEKEARKSGISTKNIIVAMIGENVHGRVLSNSLFEHKVDHKCIIEKQTISYH